MSINYPQDWNQRAKEIAQNSIKLKEGEYKAIIDTAYVGYDDKGGYEVVKINYIIQQPEEFKYKKIARTYVLDSSYPNPKKVLIDRDQFDSLISGLGKIYTSKETLIKALDEIKGRGVIITVSTQKNNPNYFNYYIKALPTQPKQIKALAPNFSTQPQPNQQTYVQSQPQPNSAQSWVNSLDDINNISDDPNEIFEF
ncbi:hypothetical protein [[Mycoplasma] gypis]|uniref:Uncharacterized protein n=1 Tax=[Mycoplasma] gypis TaxID=92404 RepID=A0ABZ2RNL2_9BACT|nr:hypothetical protein [[Mycoplasma] gypis]MBN0919450.1 hypothetical protein [[Mycoplasma] gypis]